MSGPGSDGEPDIRIVVADDQTAIREALATVLDLQPGLCVVATATNGAEAVSAADTHRPDVVLMDLNMPRMNGVEATAIICERWPDVAVVVLTTFADEQSILAALGAGARGYLTKDSGRADIARAVRSAAAGQAVMDPVVQQRLLVAATKGSTDDSASPPAVSSTPASARAADPTGADATAADATAADLTVTDVIPADLAVADLTPREIEVLTLVGAGLSNRAIAGRLFVSEATVKTHINNLFAKARLRDRAHAVNYAFTHGLVRPDR